MKVLLTGASGYLGRHVLSQLKSAGIQTVTLGRSRPRGHEDVAFIEADLLQTTSLLPLLKPLGATHLLHLAWYADYGKYWTSPLNFDWVSASLRLVQAFEQSGGQRVVVAGSCAEYAWDDGYLHEFRSEHAPVTLYGIAKDAARRLITAQCSALGMSCAWGHVFFPFGPGEAPQRMIPSLIGVFKGRLPPFGVNASAFRGLLYVPDAARAFVSLVQTKENEMFNICSGNPICVADVVRILARACDADPNCVLDIATCRPGDPHLLAGDNQRLRATGWQPQWTVEDGLLDLVRQTQ